MKKCLEKKQKNKHTHTHTQNVQLTRILEKKIQTKVHTNHVHRK